MGARYIVFKDNNGKECGVCRKYMHRCSFTKDSSKKDGYYALCKGCIRARYGVKKMAERTETLCENCSKVYYPRPNQKRNNKKGKMYCSNKCKRDYLSKTSTVYYSGYKPYILERDGHKCFLCGETSQLDAHHIKTRGSGGTDNYNNLIILCRNCHITKAHGIDKKYYRSVFESYTERFIEPEFWHIVMEKSNRDRSIIRNNINTKAKKAYHIKKNDKEYKDKIAIQKQKRDAIYFDRYGMTYKAYWHAKNKEKIMEQKQYLKERYGGESQRKVARARQKSLYCKNKNE